MEEIFRIGVIHRICIKYQYKSFRKSFSACSAMERAFYRGMAYAYGFISDCCIRRIGDIFPIAYVERKSK